MKSFAFKTKHLPSIFFGITCLLSGFQANQLQAMTPDLPQVKIDQRGNKVAVWEIEQDGVHVIHGSMLQAEATIWKKPTTLSKKGAYSFQPLLAMNDTGHAVAVWLSRNPTTQHTSVYAASLLPGANWSSAKQISPDDHDVGTDIKVELNQAGHAVVLWNAHQSSTNHFAIYSASATVGSSWSSPSVVSTVTTATKQ